MNHIIIVSRFALPTAAARPRFWRELALQDWVVGVYLAVLLALTLAGDGPRRGTALLYLTADCAAFALALGLSRGGLLPRTPSALVYRVGLFTGIFGSFSHLQYILPTARAVRVDAQLYAFDKAVFGVEPAEWFDRYVSTSTTEWFSFFYFGYFFVLAAHLLPFLFGARSTPVLAELSLGIVGLFCIGHLAYVVVPGYGPYQHLAGRFVHELDGPVWWRAVRAMVDAGEVSARTDIFPSLHTAAPTYLALFSFRHRRSWPFRVTWIPLALFASQIAVSTMFLRWHYLIDVLAGLGLAIGLSFAAPWIARVEAARRAARSVTPVYTTPWRERRSQSASAERASAAGI